MFFAFSRRFVGGILPEVKGQAGAFVGNSSILVPELPGKRVFTEDETDLARIGHWNSSLRRTPRSSRPTRKQFA